MLTIWSPPVSRWINGTVRSSFIVDAKFEVLGAPYSLLSASLSASQILYTRRGTLVGVSGKAENVRASKGIYWIIGLANGSRLSLHFPCLGHSVDLFWESHSSTKRSIFSILFLDMLLTSADLVGKSTYSTHFYQVSYHVFRGGALEWNHRLDSGSTTCSSSMDRTHPHDHSYNQQANGLSRYP